MHTRKKDGPCAWRAKGAATKQPASSKPLGISDCSANTAKTAKTRKTRTSPALHFLVLTAGLAAYLALPELGSWAGEQHPLWFAVCMAVLAAILGRTLWRELWR